MKTNIVIFDFDINKGQRDENFNHFNQERLKDTDLYKLH